VDAYGFERPDDFDYKSYDEFMSHYVHVLARRAGRWTSLLGGTDQLTVSQKCKVLDLLLDTSFVHCLNCEKL